MKLVHKSNTRSCPTRAAELFDNLPLQMKQTLGFPFTITEIVSAVQEHKVPPFWAEQQPDFNRAVTRSKSKEDSDILQWPSLTFSSDESDSDSEIHPITSKHVTFSN